MYQNNFSNNQNQQYDDAMRKTYLEQKNRHTEMLNSLLDPMKKKWKKEVECKVMLIHNYHLILIII